MPLPRARRQLGKAGRQQHPVLPQLLCNPCGGSKLAGQPLWKQSAEETTESDVCAIPRLNLVREQTARGKLSVSVSYGTRGPAG